jgi:hypothetical protein
MKLQFACFAFLALLFAACENAPAQSPAPLVTSSGVSFRIPTLTAVPTGPIIAATAAMAPILAPSLATATRPIDVTPPQVTPTPYVFPTPEPPAMRMLEKQELVTRVENYLNQVGYSSSLYIGFPPQPPTDCSVRFDAFIHPQAASEVPLVLMSLEGNPYCTGMFIFRWDGHVWHRYDFDISTLSFGIDPAFSAARHEVRNGRIELGVVWINCVHCSTNQVSYRLLRLVDNQWLTVWQPTDPHAWRGGQGGLKFIDGLNTLEVSYSDFSWLGADAKLRPDGRMIFGESTGGPHRYFIDTWKREGDRYRLAQTVSLPSTYKTAVEFCYALNHADDKGAAAWTTDVSLVGLARRLTLDKMLLGVEVAYAVDDDTRGTVLIGSYNPGGGSLILLRMVKGKTDWLISSIEKTDNPTPPTR